MESIEKIIARQLLEIKAVRLSPEKGAKDRYNVRSAAEFMS
jgi:hypothetical protein